MTKTDNGTQKRNSRNNRNVIEIDLKELAIILISQWLYLLVSGILAAIVAFGIRFFIIKPVYESNSLLYVLNKSTSMHTGATAFKYKLKVSSRTGEETSELIISTRENGKTITRSSVELALERYLAVQEECGYVKGPKEVQVFGGSYLYSIFLAWKIIRDKPLAE